MYWCGSWISKSKQTTWVKYSYCSKFLFRGILNFLSPLFFFHFIFNVGVTLLSLSSHSKKWMKAGSVYSTNSFRSVKFLCYKIHKAICRGNSNENSTWLTCQSNKLINFALHKKLLHINQQLLNWPKRNL